MWCVALPIGVLLVRAQSALCASQTSRIFGRYLEGDLGAVFRARLLMRWLVAIVWSLLPGEWFPENANTFLQIAFAWVGLVATFFIAWQVSGHVASALAALLLSACWLVWGMLPLGFSIAYPYDLPAFAFSALGMFALLRGRVVELVGVVLFGTLNKETTVWLVFAALLMESQRTSWRRGLAVAGAAMAAYAVAYAGPRIWLAGSLSPMRWLTVDLVEDKAAGTSRIVSNLLELLTLRHGSPSENVYWFFVLFLPGLLGWRRLAAPLRSFTLAASVHVVANFVCGNLWEVRIFNELVPLGATSAVAVLVPWLEARGLAPELTSGRAGEEVARTKGAPPGPG